MSRGRYFDVLAEKGENRVGDAKVENKGRF